MKTKKKKKQIAWSEIIAVLIGIGTLAFTLIPVTRFLRKVTTYCCPSTTHWIDIRGQLIGQPVSNLMFCIGLVFYLFSVIVFSTLVYGLVVDLIRVYKLYKKNKANL